MDSDQERLFADALRLPPAARAALAEQLIRSLDPAETREVEAAWAAELGRRQREIEDGSVRGVPWSEVQKKLQDALQKPR